MTLKEKINADLFQAVKQRKEIERSTLRMLKAAILNREKEKRYRIAKGTMSVPKTEPVFLEKELVAKSELTDEEVIEVIFSEIKKREEAALAFETGKRPELAEKERKEAVILKNYLPELASEEEIRVLAEEAIKEIGAKEMKDMGRVMADLVPKLKGRADNTLVSRVVKELLTAPPR